MQVFRLWEALGPVFPLFGTVLELPLTDGRGSRVSAGQRCSSLHSLPCNSTVRPTSPGLSEAPSGRQRGTRTKWYETEALTEGARSPNMVHPGLPLRGHQVRAELPGPRLRDHNWFSITSAQSCDILQCVHLWRARTLPACALGRVLERSIGLGSRDQPNANAAPASILSTGDGV